MSHNYTHPAHPVLIDAINAVIDGVGRTGVDVCMSARLMGLELELNVTPGTSQYTGQRPTTSFAPIQQPTATFIKDRVESCIENLADADPDTDTDSNSDSEPELDQNIEENSAPSPDPDINLGPYLTPDQRHAKDVYERFSLDKKYMTHDSFLPIEILDNVVNLVNNPQLTDTERRRFTRKLITSVIKLFFNRDPKHREKAEKSVSRCVIVSGTILFAIRLIKKMTGAGVITDESIAQTVIADEDMHTAWCNFTCLDPTVDGETYMDTYTQLADVFSRIRGMYKAVWDDVINDPDTLLLFKCSLKVLVKTLRKSIVSTNAVESLNEKYLAVTDSLRDLINGGKDHVDEAVDEFFLFANCCVSADVNWDVMLS